MAELDILATALNTNVILRPTENGNSAKTILTESSGSATLRRVVISGLSTNDCVLKPDRVKVFTSLFSGSKGELRRCDYVILTEISSKKYAIFIELKSTSLNSGRYKQQLKGGVCLVEYIDSVLTHFYNQSGILTNYEKRYAVLYHLPISKTNTRPSSLPRNSTPSKALRYNVDTSNQLSISELVV